tara:strand:+ start:6333 stop:6794 length:462 start_codon:yes stop_codon:yes gene_type:complete
MSKIIEFYEGTRRNQEGYSIDDIIDFTDTGLERGHTYIQWIFPLPEKSKAVPNSPVLTQTDIDEFNRRSDLQNTMKELLVVMLNFYHSSSQWLTPHNHNFLRITRIIRSSKLLGLEKESQIFYNNMCAIYEKNERVIGPVTKQFWDEAITKDF